jgi:SAM-dependent methyltransferase
MDRIALHQNANGKEWPSGLASGREWELWSEDLNSLRFPSATRNSDKFSLSFFRSLAHGIVMLRVALIAAIFLAPFAIAEDGEDPAHYSRKTPSRDGTGKVYMGREISQVVSQHAIGWLERRDREGEEKPSLVMDHLELPKDGVVADIGAGSGYFSFLIAPLVPEGKVIAVDIQQEMLDFVEGKKKLKKVSNVETHLGTIEDTKLTEDTVDLAILVDAYHEFSHPREMAVSILKGLKPGGRLVLLEYRGEDPSVPIKPLHKMTVKQVRSEMEAIGFEFSEVRDFLPIQHFLVFRKPTKS